MDADVRRAILEEVAIVRAQRTYARAAADVALTNARGMFWRQRADSHNLTLVHLMAVLERIRAMEQERAREWLDATAGLSETELRYAYGDK